MNILVMLIIYAVDVVNYCLGLRVIFGLKIKRWWPLPVFMTAYYFVIIYVNPNEYEMFIILYIFLLITILILIHCNSFKILSKILLMMLSLASFEDGLEMLYHTVFKKSLQITGTPESWGDYLAASLTCIFIFILINYIKKNMVQLKNKVEHFLKTKMYFILFVPTFLLLFSATTLSVVSTNETNRGFIRFISAIIILSFLSIGVLIMVTVYIKHMNENLERLIKTEKHFNETKIKYYETLLEREEQTKKYRHDMNNHLICLNELLEKGKLDEINHYLNKMREQLNLLQSFYYDAGNVVFNALLNAYLSTLDDAVIIKISGKCSKDLSIDDIDLCIIFSNLLQNAIEELHKSSLQKKFIIITFHQGEKFLKVEIINSRSIEVGKRNTLLKTTKKDKKNHGIGLNNVRETLKINHGYFEFKSTEEKFYVSFILINDSAR